MNEMIIKNISMNLLLNGINIDNELIMNILTNGKYKKNKEIIQYNSINLLAINLSKIKNKNKEKIFEILKSRYLKNYYNQDKNIIFLSQYNTIQHNIQIKLKSMIDELSVNNYLILGTNNYSHIHESIRSRFQLIRIPNKSIELLHYDPLKKLCLDIVNIYNHDYEYLNNYKIENIKELSYKLCKYILNIKEFYRELLSLFLSSGKFTNSIKTKLVYLFSESESNYNKSYRKIIHIEGLLIQIYYLITNDEIDRHNKE